MRVPRLTLKTVFVAVAVAVALIQFVSVTLAALPPNRYSAAAAPHTNYLRPMFTQDWRLFAPNPIADDRTVSFQGSYRGADGSLKHTKWVDWTEVELDLIHHRLIWSCWICDQQAVQPTHRPVFLIAPGPAICRGCHP